MAARKPRPKKRFEVILVPPGSGVVIKHLLANVLIMRTEAYRIGPEDQSTELV
jgi:hypothetical protein